MTTTISSFFIPSIEKDADLFDAKMDISAPAILVVNNAGIASIPGITGAGNATSPYILANQTIDASYLGTVVEIRNTNVPFHFRNCTVINSGSGTNDRGIYLQNCTNITIENCTIRNNRRAIFLYYSHHDVLMGNNISVNTEHGIYLENSNFTLITRNLVHRNNGIGIYMTLRAQNNDVTMNSFMTNALGNYYCDSPGNSWYGGIIGNYWDNYHARYLFATNDYITWNTPYVINSTLNQQDEYPLVSYAGVHAPINIDGNSQLDQFPEKTGAGTLLSPYLIRNLKIGAGTSANCIVLKNTNKYVTFFNITVTGANSSTIDAGFFVQNCTNVNISHCRALKNSIGSYVMDCAMIVAENNNFSMNGYHGFLIETSNQSTLFKNALMMNTRTALTVDGGFNNSIANSTISNNGIEGILIQNNANNISVFNNTVGINNTKGIYIKDSANISIFQNSIGKNVMHEVYVTHSNSCIIEDNTINGSYHGLCLSYSRQVQISGNSFYQCNVMLDGDLIDYFINHTIDATNSIDDKPLIYQYNAQNLNSPLFSGAGGVILANCTNCSVKDLALSPATTGIQLYFSRNNTVENCSATGMIEAGIYLVNSTNNTIKKCFMNNCNNSIVLLKESNDNSISNNTLVSNRIGIYCFTTRRNLVQYNTMNGCGVYIEGPDDVYYNSHTMDSTNHINLRPLYYYVNRTSLNSTSFANAGQIILINCTTSTIVGCNVSNTTLGIMAYKSPFNDISNVHASYNSMYGIFLTSYSSDNVIYNCTVVENHRTGLLIYRWCQRNQVTNCTISFNGEDGIFCLSRASSTIIRNNTLNHNLYGVHTSFMSSQVNITDNDISLNREHGIFIEGTNNHFIIGNNISFNQHFGVYIAAGAYPNTIYSNIIVDNAYSEAYSTHPINYWDNGSIGNFWGDYQLRYPGATKAGNIWDTPYEINGTPGVYDHFPFYRNSVPIASIYAESIVGLTGMAMSFRFNGTIGDVPNTYQWYFGDSTSNSTAINPSHTFLTERNWTVSVTIRDRNGDRSTKRVTVYILSPAGDHDIDGLDNSDEILTYHTNPFVKDTDGDGMPDGWEVVYGFLPLNDSDATEDADQDFLTNVNEFIHHTYPHDNDSDDDGFIDGVEVQWGSNPMDRNSTPVTMWVIWPSIIGGILAVLIIVSVKARRRKKSRLIEKPSQAAPAPEQLDIGAALSADASEFQRRLSEKQTMLARALEPQTRTEALASQQEEAAEPLEAIKAKKAKTGASHAEVIEHKIDEKLEQELKPELKEEKCIVCETPLKGTSYVCPECKTKYCIRCAVMLSQRNENCWVCKKILKFD